jgi:hypothetical protein
VDPKSAAILCPIYPLDLNRNANQVRMVFETTNNSTNNSHVGKAATPRLLEKYIEDYAAEGAPIAYIPIEEEV